MIALPLVGGLHIDISGAMPRERGADPVCVLCDPDGRALMVGARIASFLPLRFFYPDWQRARFAAFVSRHRLHQMNIDAPHLLGDLCRFSARLKTRLRFRQITRSGA